MRKLFPRPFGGNGARLGTLPVEKDAQDLIEALWARCILQSTGHKPSLCFSSNHLPSVSDRCRAAALLESWRPLRRHWDWSELHSAAEELLFTERTASKQSNLCGLCRWVIFHYLDFFCSAGHICPCNGDLSVASHAIQSPLFWTTDNEFFQFVRLKLWA